jgi:uncharacterized protein (TIGR03067 family)
MMRRLLWVPGVLLALAVTAATSGAPGADQPPNAPDEKAERARLVGVWKGYTVEGKGENPDAGPVKLELTFTERTIQGIEIREAERFDHGEGEYTLQLDTEPRRLDAAKSRGAGRKQEYIGIYRLEGDTLKWCVSPRKVRPETFETVKGQYLLILKRDKPAGPGAQ